MVIIEANKEKSNAIVPENITIMARSIHEVTKQDFSAIVSELT